MKKFAAAKSGNLDHNLASIGIFVGNNSPSSLLLLFILLPKLTNSIYFLFFWNFTPLGIAVAQEQMAFDKDVENRTHPRAWVGGPRSTSLWLNSLGMWKSSIMLASVDREGMSSLRIVDDPFKPASVSPELPDVPSGLSLCAWAAGNWSCKNTTGHKYDSIK